MNINEMSDEEKSVMLARLCGWRIDFRGDKFYAPKDISYEGMKICGWDINRGDMVRDLYELSNMPLAWRVLNWAMSLSDVRLTRPVTGLQTESIEVEFDLHFDEWFCEMQPLNDGRGMVDLPPADAQRAWLDKILTLALEAGMVTK